MNDKNTLLWICRKIRRRIPMLLSLVAVNACSAACGVVFALGTRQIIDTAVSGSWDAFFRSCLLQAAIILAILLCQAANRYFTGRLTMELDRDWKKALLQKLLRGEYAEVSKHHSGELINRLNNDVRILDDGVIGVLPGLVSMVVQVAAALVVLIGIQPMFAMVIIAMGLLVIVVSGLVRPKLKNLHKLVSETDGRVLGFLQENLEKLMVVQALDVTEEVEKRADGLLEERYAVQKRRRNVSLLSNLCISTLYRLAGFVALIWCAFGLLHGTMSFGTLTAVTQLVSQIQTPFVNLSGVLPKYLAMVAAAERLIELDQITVQGDADLPEPAVVYQRMTHLQARELTFSYGKDPVLEGASFALPKGAFAAMTGASGIGKSTLLKLLLGIYPAQSGGLYLCGGEEDIPLSRHTRKLFAYVPQGNYLFSGSILENLLLIRPEATEEELRQALYVSDMEAYLDQLPKGLDTVLGENGQGLSEGQAQRLAIARAVLSGAPILLLDEATSALDAQTEARVLQRIAAMENRTCIAVTHRPAALELADWQLDAADHTIHALKRK